MNGRVFPEMRQYSPGDMVQYVCNNNRMPLHGPTNATCNNKGQWMPRQLPTCPRKRYTIDQNYFSSPVDIKFVALRVLRVQYI